MNLLHICKLETSRLRACSYMRYVVSMDRRPSRVEVPTIIWFHPVRLTRNIYMVEKILRGLLLDQSATPCGRVQLQHQHNTYTGRPAEVWLSMYMYLALTDTAWLAIHPCIYIYIYIYIGKITRTSWCPGTMLNTYKICDVLYIP
jgi:hypothetical protein